MIDVSREIKFQTARSSGKGGQHVNKVESMVEGYFHVNNSALLSSEQKARIETRLANRITSSGELLVKSQVHRGQLANKREVTRQINKLIAHALKKEKVRVATKPGKAAREKRLQEKKKGSDTKQTRKKIRFNDYL